jgi:hypothetical protein
MMLWTAPTVAPENSIPLWPDLNFEVVGFQTTVS